MMFDIYYSTDAEEINNGTLWRVTAPNGAQNYLHGTAHLPRALDPALFAGSQELNYLFYKSKKFLFEIPTGGTTRSVLEIFTALQQALAMEIPADVTAKLIEFPVLYPELHAASCAMAHEIVSDIYLRASFALFAMQHPPTIEDIKQ